jgi:MFS transporter, DHA2 family, multidrug resistance protein
VTSRFASALAPATADLPAAARDAAGTGLAGALRVARDLPAAASADLADAARDAFVSGLSAAAVVAAVVAAGAAAAAAALLPRRPATEPAAESDTRAPAEVVDLPLDDPEPVLARDRAS